MKSYFWQREIMMTKSSQMWSLHNLMSWSARSEQISTLNLIASYVPYTAPVYNQTKKHIRIINLTGQISKKELTQTMHRNWNYFFQACKLFPSQQLLFKLRRIHGRSNSKNFIESKIEFQKSNKAPNKFKRIFLLHLLLITICNQGVNSDKLFFYMNKNSFK